MWATGSQFQNRAVALLENHDRGNVRGSQGITRSRIERQADVLQTLEMFIWLCTDVHRGYALAGVNHGRVRDHFVIEGILRRTRNRKIYRQLRGGVARARDLEPARVGAAFVGVTVIGADTYGDGHLR